MSDYRLYDDAARLLGSYATFEDALAAHYEHVLIELVRRRRWSVIASLIVGPGLKGPLTVHPVATHVGPAQPGLVTQEDVDDIRRWLRGISDTRR